MSHIFDRRALAALLLALFVIAALLSPHGADDGGGFSSLLPPLLAIVMAVVLRKVLVALSAAVWLGATMLAGNNPLSGLHVAVADYVLPSVTGSWLMLLFTVSLMGMVSVMVRGGGVQAIVDRLAGRAKSVRTTGLVTASMGTVIFFDDYANSMIVGASARPMTDARRISREKLAYLVDSTAAPVAGVALISTWIGIELQFLSEQLHYVPEAASAYDLFFRILPYRFYCFLTLAFVYLVVLSGRDFGPMLRAERRARTTGAVLAPGAQPMAGTGVTDTRPAPGAPPRMLNAILPVALVILTAFGGFMVAGYGPLREAGETFDLLRFATWRAAFIYGGDETPLVLATAGGVGALAAILLVVTQRILSLGDACLTFVRGIWAMRLALYILVMAIALRNVTEALDTALFLVSLLGELPVIWLPLISFGLAAVVAFATGTSWGTMGILLPVVVPLVHHQLAQEGTLIAAGPVLLLAAASVLDGAIFGDHCSPISDTTVLSSVATACDHIDHVRTQAPYAMVSMGAAAVMGYLLIAWTGWSVLVTYLGGVALMLLVLLLVGRRPGAKTIAT